MLLTQCTLQLSYVKTAQSVIHQGFIHHTFLKPLNKDRNFKVSMCCMHTYTKKEPQKLPEYTSEHVKFPGAFPKTPNYHFLYLPWATPILSAALRLQQMHVPTSFTIVLNCFSHTILLDKNHIYYSINRWVNHESKSIVNHNIEIARLCQSIKIPKITPFRGILEYLHSKQSEFVTSKQ